MYINKNAYFNEINDNNEMFQTDEETENDTLTYIEEDSIACNSEEGKIEEEEVYVL